MQRQGGRADNSGETALIKLFKWKPEQTDFGSDGFKLLWEREKGADVGELKKWMREMPELRDVVVAAVPDAAVYYI